MIRTPYSLAILAYCGVIFWLSSQPEPLHLNMNDIAGLDKVLHMLAYGGLAALVSVGLRRSREPVHPMVQFLGPVALAFLYGMFDECHQYFVPERMFDPLDLVADLSGALLVQWALCKYVWKIPIGRQAGN